MKPIIISTGLAEVDDIKLAATKTKYNSENFRRTKNIDINYVKDMVDSLSQGDNIGAEKAFKDALAGKISAALDTKRTDVAKSWLNEPQEVPTDETPQEVEVTSDVPSDEKPEIAEPGVDPMVQKLADQENVEEI